MNMRVSGYEFKMLSGNDVHIAPRPGAAKCVALHDGFEISIDTSTGAFTARAVEPHASNEGILSFRKAEFEFPESSARASDDEDTIGVLWCRATNCCCNCGAGWVCG